MEQFQREKECLDYHLCPSRLLIVCPYPHSALNQDRATSCPGERQPELTNLHES